VLDSSKGKTPLPYLHGHGGIIPGLEKELDGRSVGDEFNVKIEPKDGYGERNETLVQKVPRDQLAHIPELKAGVQLQAQTPQGQQIVMVSELSDSEATLDANHPLAGVTLHFEVKVATVRAATQEELDHGHAHGPGGAHH
jgi:FKBP-type peptidyl-prolyl cis-trans isomerase SlyD